MALPVSGISGPGPTATQLARDSMVDSQIRPNKVTDPRIIRAMRMIAREAFVSPAQNALAYADADIRLAGGRAIAAPMTVARLLQLAEPVAGERALVIACGTGYGAAVLLACGVAVVAVEEDDAQLLIARAALAAWGAGVQLVSGPLAQPPVEGPFDLILIEGGIARLPDSVADLLSPDGRVVAVRCRANGGGQAVVGRRSLGAVNFVPAFDLPATKLASFQVPAGFVF